MENKLLVSPEKLKTTASDFSAQATQVKSLHDEMINKVNALSSVWTGSAGDSYRNKFAALKKAMETIYRMIQEHVKDLNDMADQYTSADTSIESIIDELPTSDL